MKYIFSLYHFLCWIKACISWFSFFFGKILINHDLLIVCLNNQMQCTGKKTLQLFVHSFINLNINNQYGRKHKHLCHYFYLFIFSRSIGYVIQGFFLCLFVCRCLFVIRWWWHYCHSTDTTQFSPSSLSSVIDLFLFFFCQCLVHFTLETFVDGCQWMLIIVWCFK